jgi:hypothetical protein
MDQTLRGFFDTTITNWELIGLLILPLAIYGIKRGWQEEGFTAIGLGITVSALGQGFGKFLIILLNRVIGVFPLGVAIILRKPADQWPELGQDIIPQEGRWANLAVFVVMVLVCYRAGTILGRRKGVFFLGRIAGGIFGAMNGVMILARVFYLLQPLEQTTEVTIPTITVLGLRADMLNGIVVGLTGFVIALFLLLAWFQRRRAKE